MLLDPTRTRFLSRFKTNQVISSMAAPENNCSAFAAVSFQLDASASCRSMPSHLPGLIQYDYDVSLPFEAHLGPACHRASAVPPSLFVCFLWRHSFIFVWVGCPQLIFFWLLRTVSSHFCPYVCVCQATILTIVCLRMLFFIKSKLQCTSLSVFYLRLAH